MKRFFLIIICMLVFTGRLPAQQSVAGTPVTLQSAATADGNGSTLTTERYNALRLRVTITGGATVNFEVRTDGTNWDATSNAYNVTAPTTAAGTATATGSFVVFTGGAPFRARISGYASGTVTVYARPFFSTSARAVTGGGGGSPGGSNTQLQFNNSSAFGGAAGLIWDSTNSVFYVNAAQRIKRTATATDYTILVGDYLVAVTSTAAPRTITLPAISGVSVGQVFVVVDESDAAGTNAITVTRAGSDLFVDGGATSQTINVNGTSLSVYSTGTAWKVIK